MNKELLEKIITYNYNEYGSEFGDALVYLKHENEWMHHIINEVREYIKNLREDDEYLEELHFSFEDKYKLLEILDTVDKE